jgi:hypothetical protein
VDKHPICNCPLYCTVLWTHIYTGLTHTILWCHSFPNM